MRNRFPRSFYIPKGATKISDKQSDAVAYVATHHSGKTHLVAFAGKADKPFMNYLTRKPEQHVSEFFQNRRDHAKRQQERREERTQFIHNVKVGDIFRTSWGYDQTNVEFFEVTEVRGKFAILREIAQASESNGYGQDKTVPQSGSYLDGERGEPIRRLIQKGHIKIDDVRYAWPWGERVAGVVVGKPAYATSTGWGH